MKMCLLDTANIIANIRVKASRKEASSHTADINNA